MRMAAAEGLCMYVICMFSVFHSYEFAHKYFAKVTKLIGSNAKN